MLQNFNELQIVLPEKEPTLAQFIQESQFFDEHLECIEKIERNGDS